MHSIQLKKPTKKTKNNEYREMYLKRKKKNSLGTLKENNQQKKRENNQGRDFEENVRRK